jgi:TRAP-type C4-dicarboxylate transport system permease small subunit
MNKLDNGMKNVERFVEHIGGFACFLLMVAVCWGVVERYFLKISVIQGLYNMTETYIFPVLVFTAIAGSYRAGLWPRLKFGLTACRPDGPGIST